MGARRGGGGKSRPSPPPSKKIFGGYIGGLCFFFIWEPFCYVFLILGAFWLLFISWCRPFFGLPPPPTKISAGAHDCKERACSPKFFCVTAILDMFCYDFALKMRKIMINCSHVAARWV